jgi:hypothetical protein
VSLDLHRAPKVPQLQGLREDKKQKENNLFLVDYSFFKYPGLAIYCAVKISKERPKCIVYGSLQTKQGAPHVKTKKRCFFNFCSHPVTKKIPNSYTYIKHCLGLNDVYILVRNSSMARL